MPAWFLFDGIICVMNSLMNILAVFLGGGLGAVLRYLTGFIVISTKFGSAPATLCVNVLASLILGLGFGYFAMRTNIPPYAKLALTCGFCGGLSTFSTFAFETLRMFEASEIVTAIIYIGLSVVLCVAAAAVGIYVGRIV